MGPWAMVKHRESHSEQLLSTMDRVTLDSQVSLLEYNQDLGGSSHFEVNAFPEWDPTEMGVCLWESIPRHSKQKQRKVMLCRPTLGGHTSPGTPL